MHNALTRPTTRKFREIAQFEKNDLCEESFMPKSFIQTNSAEKLFLYYKLGVRIEISLINCGWRVA